MNWADMMKAAALAAGAGHRPLETSVGVPWIWNPGEVWLARVRMTHESVVGSSAHGASIPARQDSTQSA
jgi:hypothetical protein